ncbi:MAG TPA: hypothetical protein PKA17_09870 [Phenylobacterium sp.]|nr:hypothetical protein [Phenylobacterium sp.]
MDDAKIPEDGRVVKCASCGHRWMARREVEPAPLPPTPLDPQPLAAAPAADSPARPADQASPESDLEAAPAT